MNVVWITPLYGACFPSLNGLLAAFPLFVSGQNSSSHSVLAHLVGGLFSSHVMENRQCEQFTDSAYLPCIAFPFIAVLRKWLQKTAARVEKRERGSL